MGLLERVGTLIRANLNDLIDRAEDPEKMLKQLILDMQNQLMQVKTQVAIAVADRHLLDTKRKENAAAEADWLGKADSALGHGRDDLARHAADKALEHRQAAANYAEQLEDQTRQVDQLKSALSNLERKLSETRTRSDLLLARHRRAKTSTRAAQSPAAPLGTDPSFDRMRDKVRHEEALGAAYAELAAEDASEEILALERNERIDQVLDELRKKRG